jgi:hypothetical protein
MERPLRISTQSAGRNATRGAVLVALNALGRETLGLVAFGLKPSRGGS